MLRTGTWLGQVYKSPERMEISPSLLLWVVRVLENQRFSGIIFYISCFVYKGEFQFEDPGHVRVVIRITFS